MAGASQGVAGRTPGLRGPVRRGLSHCNPLASSSVGQVTKRACPALLPWRSRLSPETPRLMHPGPGPSTAENNTVLKTVPRASRLPPRLGQGRSRRSQTVSLSRYGASGTRIQHDLSATYSCVEIPASQGQDAIRREGSSGVCGHRPRGHTALGRASAGTSRRGWTGEPGRGTVLPVVDITWAPTASLCKFYPIASAYLGAE